MSAISYGGLEWQEEQLLGLVWLLERHGWSISFQRKAGSSAITVALEQDGAECSGTCAAQPGQLFSSWGALQAAMANLPVKPVTAGEIDRLVHANVDLQSQRASAWEALEQLRSENTRLEAEAFESRRLFVTLLKRLGGAVTIDDSELVGKEAMLVRTSFVGERTQYEVQEPGAPV